MTSSMPSQFHLPTTLRKEKRSFAVDEVPELFHEKFILTGYRNPSSSALQCIFSAFEWTNETANIWTHFIPTAYFFWYAIHILTKLWISTSYHFLPLFIYACAVSCYPLASAAAHIFNVMSARARHLCFFIDYYALCIYGFGSALAYNAYSLPISLNNSFLKDLYLPLTGLVAVVSFAVSCSTRFIPSGKWRKFIRFSSFAIPYLADLSPMFYRLIVDGEDAHPTASYYHGRQYMFAALAAFFYCSHLPERWWPGRFDVIGHSHQVFHMLTVVGSRDQLIALWIDTEESLLFLSLPHSPAPSLPVLPVRDLILVLLFLLTSSAVMIFFILRLEPTTSTTNKPVRRGDDLNSDVGYPSGSSLESVNRQTIMNGYRFGPYSLLNGVDSNCNGLEEQKKND